MIVDLHKVQNPTLNTRNFPNVNTEVTFGQNSTLNMVCLFSSTPNHTIQFPFDFLHVVSPVSFFLVILTSVFFIRDLKSTSRFL